ncbi:MAG: WD40 repeat domain-containing protein, partial [Hyphomicrobiaceae bacterium]
MALLGVSAAAQAQGQPPQEPILRIEPGMHTAMINRIGVDAACRWMVTGADDKTARLWDVTGAAARLVRTLRVPIGEGNAGKIYAVALSADGQLVAAGGWTTSGDEWVYLFEAANGRLMRRLGPLGSVVFHLAFSPDDRHLAATLGGGQGVRVWETAGWRLVGEDKDYGGAASFGAAFAAAERLFTVAIDGHLRRYG